MYLFTKTTIFHGIIQPKTQFNGIDVYCNGSKPKGPYINCTGNKLNNFTLPRSNNFVINVIIWKWFCQMVAPNFHGIIVLKLLKGNAPLALLTRTSKRLPLQGYKSAICFEVHVWNQFLRVNKSQNLKCM